MINDYTKQLAEGAKQAIKELQAENAKLRAAIGHARATCQFVLTALSVPAAEYVPCIRDCFGPLKRILSETARCAEPPAAPAPPRETDRARNEAEATMITAVLDAISGQYGYRLRSFDPVVEARMQGIQQGIEETEQVVVKALQKLGFAIELKPGSYEEEQEDAPPAPPEEAPASE